MRNYTFHWEIKTLIAQFCDAFNDVIIKRYNNNREEQDKIHVNFYYGPKNRVLHDLVNKAQHIKIPIIAVHMSGISRDENRVFNKLEGPYYTNSPLASGYENLWQPVPVNITVNMSIITRFQEDLDQIVTNFVPYCDPYITVSWRMPYTDLEMRSIIQWSGDISLNPPIDISHDTAYRWTADTTFTIAGWLFKLASDPIGKIYKIDSSFTAVDQIFDDFYLMKSKETEDNTDVFIISARPQITQADPWITTPCRFPEITIQGYMFDYATNIYLTNVFPVTTINGIVSSLQTLDGYPFADINYYDPVSGSKKLSAYYPGFSGIEVPSADWRIESPHLITMTMPSALSGGYAEIIISNEAGYGRLTWDAVRPTLNPYTSGTPEYDSYIEWQHPSVSGIRISPFYSYCT